MVVSLVLHQLSDLRDVNRILKKVSKRDSGLRYEKIEEREDLIAVGIGDTSFKTEEKAVGGVFLFLTGMYIFNKNFLEEDSL